jgi:hypothetical protein
LIFFDTVKRFVEVLISRLLLGVAPEHWVSVLDANSELFEEYLALILTLPQNVKPKRIERNLIAVVIFCIVGLFTFHFLLVLFLALLAHLLANLVELVELGQRLLELQIAVQLHRRKQFIFQIADVGVAIAFLLAQLLEVVVHLLG